LLGDVEVDHIAMQGTNMLTDNAIALSFLRKSQAVSMKIWGESHLFLKVGFEVDGLERPHSAPS